MKKIIIVLLSFLLVMFLFGCEDTWAGDSATEDFGADEKNLSLKEFQFYKIDESSSGSFLTYSRNILGTGLNIPEAMDEPLDGKSIVSSKNYGFSQFKFTTDIILRSDTNYEENRSRLDILNWSGDADDLTNYIDLIAGEVVDNSEEIDLPKAKFDSVMLQVDAPGETIIPNFGSDSYSETSFSWGDLKPFNSVTSNTQTILLSTYVDQPMVRWVQGPTPAIFSTLTIVQDYNSEHPDLPISDLMDWAYNHILPMNQDFFNALEAVESEYTTHPLNTGEAWLILPLNAPIDFSLIDSAVTINFEFYLDDMVEVHTCDDSSQVIMLSGSKEYSDAAGNKYYSPFPVKITVQAEE